MSKGKLIVIEGTDCSGKQTQSELLIKEINNNGGKIKRFAFPNYDSPTGKLIGGPCLGKDYICSSYFDEGFAKVDPKVVSLYYAADRLYNVNDINNALNEGFDVILDRYVYSNMAHQGGKEKNSNKRKELYDFISTLEFDLCNLPKPDLVIFLYMPFEAAKVLRENRNEKLDDVEKDNDYLLNSEKTYLEIAKLFNFVTINCANNNTPRDINDIAKDVLNTYNNLRK